MLYMYIHASSAKLLGDDQKEKSIPRVRWKLAAGQGAKPEREIDTDEKSKAGPEREIDIERKLNSRGRFWERGRILFGEGKRGKRPAGCVVTSWKRGDDIK